MQQHTISSRRMPAKWVKLFGDSTTVVQSVMKTVHVNVMSTVVMSKTKTYAGPASVWRENNNDNA